MGDRAVVLFDVDNLHQLKEDPNIGNRIYNAINQMQHDSQPINIGSVGLVVEKCHMDTTKLTILGLSGLFVLEEIVSSNTINNPIDLLELAANKYGYTLKKLKK
jgi:hypothetical protein